MPDPYASFTRDFERLLTKLRSESGEPMHPSYTEALGDTTMIKAFQMLHNKVLDLESKVEHQSYRIDTLAGASYTNQPQIRHSVAIRHPHCTRRA